MQCARAHRFLVFSSPENGSRRVPFFRGRNLLGQKNVLSDPNGSQSFSKQKPQPNTSHKLRTMSQVTEQVDQSLEDMFADQSVDQSMELVTPAESIFKQEEQNVFTQWGRTKIDYDLATERAVYVLINNFAGGRAHAEAEAEQHVKACLRLALSAEDQEVLRFTDAKDHLSLITSKKQEYILKRREIIRNVHKMWAKLLQKAWPKPIRVFSPPSSVKTTPVASVDTTKESTTKESASKTATGRSLEPAFDDATSMTAITSGTTKPTDDGTIASLPQASRQRYKPSSIPKTTDKDLFETSVEMLDAVRFVFDLVKEWGSCLFDPCAGRGDEGSIIVYADRMGIPTLARDKYYMEEKHDFLVDPLPPKEAYDIIVVNPPFNQKYEFLAKLISMDVPFAMLTTLDSLATKKWVATVGNLTYDIVLLNGSCHFLHAGTLRHVQSCCWVVAVPGRSVGKFTIHPLGADGDEDLDDESDPDVHYDANDPAERAAQELDEEIMRDPRNKFTKEGYLLDGLTIEDEEEFGEIGGETFSYTAKDATFIAPRAVPESVDSII